MVSVPPGPRLRAVAVALGLLVAAGAWLISSAATQARLLRADPNAIAGDRALMAFALPRGGATFATHCAGCHGAKGQGDPTSGAPNLADGDWLYGEGRADEIEQIVAFGIRSHHPKAKDLTEMPAYGSPVPSKTDKVPPLSPPEIGDVTEFLLYLEQRPADQAAAARGSKLFEDRAGCYDCHGRDAHGDAAVGAPNLTDRIWLVGDGSRKAIFNTVAQGLRGVCPAWTKKLSPAAIREVAMYVYSLSHPKPLGRSGAP